MDAGAEDLPLSAARRGPGRGKKAGGRYAKGEEAPQEKPQEAEPGGADLSSLLEVLRTLPPPAPAASASSCRKRPASAQAVTQPRRRLRSKQSIQTSSGTLTGTPDQARGREQADGGAAPPAAASASAAASAAQAPAAPSRGPAAPGARAAAPPGSGPSQPQPVLPEDSLVQMPPDGRCLYFCAVAAMHSARCMSADRDTHRFGSGLPLCEDQAAWEDEQANLVKARVCSLLLRDGNDAEASRLMRSGSHGYPGEDVLPYIAEIIGGAIRVDPPVSFRSVQPPQSYGAGQIILHLQNDYMDVVVNDDGSKTYNGSHYWVRQIWQAPQK